MANKKDKPRVNLKFRKQLYNLGKAKILTKFVLAQTQFLKEEEDTLVK